MRQLIACLKQSRNVWQRYKRVVGGIHCQLFTSFKAEDNMPAGYVCFDLPGHAAAFHATMDKRFFTERNPLHAAALGCGDG